ncbi:MAG: rod shape-determining protein MreD [Calditrichaeota bacterium]|nr:MAG: rod shape-determining protein MreD [Calditrichota bacterium]
MKRILLQYVGLFLVGLLFQSTVVPYLQIGRWKPDLLLVVVVFIGVQRGPVWGSTAGFVIGLIGDLLSAQLVGSGALVKSVAGYLAGRLSPLFDVRSQFLFTLLLVSFVHDLGYFFLLTLGQAVSLNRIVFVFTIPNVFYTVVVGMLVYFLLRGWISNEPV